MKNLSSKNLVSKLCLFLIAFYFSSCGSDEKKTPAKSSAKDITEFKFEKSKNSNLANDITGKINGTNIALTAPGNTDVAALIATFASSAKATVRVGNKVQKSGTTANNFTKAVQYVVTAEDASTKTYIVTVSLETVAVSSEKEITAFSFQANDNSGVLSDDVTGSIDASTKNITATVPDGAATTALVASFTLSANATATVNNQPQTSGTTPNDFSDAVSYVITAEDGSTQSYTVTVTTAAAASANNIETFSFQADDNDALSNDVTGSISGTNIAVTVPASTDVRELKATFTLSNGATAQVGGQPQTSGTTENDFTNPVQYVITAQDGTTTKTYTVTVTVQ